MQGVVHTRHLHHFLLIVSILIFSSFGSITYFSDSDINAEAESTLNVGPSETYKTIQAAIEAAQSGDEILVKSGTYLEQINISKKISLIGENKENTIISGNLQTGSTIYVTANNVNISGFTVTGGDEGWGEAGIYLDDVQHCWITNNICRDNKYHGIRLLFSQNNTISQNTIRKNDQSGIFLDGSKYNIISNNEISENNTVGISIGFSSNNQITSNKITGSDILGIDTWDSYYNTYNNNEIYNNNGNAIEFWGANNNIFNGNTIISNLKDGIHLQSSMNNTFENNKIQDDGFSIGGYDEEHWDTHNIAESNTINGKPVYYWKDKVGGTVPTGAGQVILAGCTNIKVENQNIKDTSEGIVLGFSNYNTIKNNILSSNSRYGITIWRSRNNNIEDNEITSNEHMGISIIDSRSNTIAKNTISDNKDGIELRSARNHRIHNNTLQNNGLYITGNFYDFWRNEYNNKIVDDEGKTIWIYSHTYWNTHNIETTNTVNNKPIYYLKNQVGGTVPEDAGQVILANCTNVRVENLTLEGGSVGLQLGFSVANLIQYNQITTNLMDGIYLESSNDNTIKKNSIQMNSKNGIYLDYSHENNISNNNILSNPENGILFYFSNKNLLTNNRIELNNNYGVYLDKDCNNNSIFHNDFMKNKNQAADFGFNNWTLSYPGGGNFWSDYTDMDNQSGPGQNQSGSDGLGDAPYENIESWESVIDDYPLISSWTERIKPPGEPREVQASAGENYVFLIWSAPASDGNSEITNYNIYRSTTSGEENLLVTVSNIFSYNDTTVTNGKTYYYKISAINDEGEGERSEEVKITPGADTDQGIGLDILLLLLIMIIIVIIAIIIGVIIKKKKPQAPKKGEGPIAKEAEDKK